MMMMIQNIDGNRSNNDHQMVAQFSWLFSKKNQNVRFHSKIHSKMINSVLVSFSFENSSHHFFPLFMNSNKMNFDFETYHSIFFVCKSRNIDFDNSVSTFLNLQCFSDCCLSIYNRYDGHVSNDHIVCLLNIGPPSFFSEQNIVGSKI